MESCESPECRQPRHHPLPAQGRRGALQEPKNHETGVVVDSGSRDSNEDEEGERAHVGDVSAQTGDFGQPAEEQGAKSLWGVNDE